MKLGNLGLYAESSKTINHAAFFVLCGRELNLLKQQFCGPKAGRFCGPDRRPLFEANPPKYHIMRIVSARRVSVVVRRTTAASPPAATPAPPAAPPGGLPRILQLKRECTVRLREMETLLMETILTFA